MSSDFTLKLFTKIAKILFCAPLCLEMETYIFSSLHPRTLVDISMLVTVSFLLSVLLLLLLLFCSLSASVLSLVSLFELGS